MPGTQVRHIDLLDNGVIVEFSDGIVATYNADFLHDNRQADDNRTVATVVEAPAQKAH
jgi:hypothetical protein